MDLKRGIEKNWLTNSHTSLSQDNAQFCDVIDILLNHRANIIYPLSIFVMNCISSVVMKYICTVLFRVFGDSHSD